MKTNWLFAALMTIFTTTIIFPSTVEAGNGYGPPKTTTKPSTNKGSMLLAKGTTPVTKLGTLPVGSGKTLNSVKWTDKVGKSPGKIDPSCKPSCDPCWKKGWGWCSNWCGWGRWPCDSWCGGWFGGWCGTVIVGPATNDPTTDDPDDDAPGIKTNPDVESASNPEAVKVQTRRFLKLKNDSGEKLEVFVQYIVRTEDGEPLWIPGEPETGKALTLDVEPGQELFVESNGKKIASSVARIWAVSSKGKLLEFRGKDLWLVPEQAPNGDHVYMAPEIKTFTFVFPRFEG
jgi:hypothetical protein